MIGDRRLAMTIPTPILGVASVILALLQTFVFRIQRGNLSNRLWDFATLALFVAGLWWIGFWDPLTNLVAGVIAGLAAIVIRDVRLWAARFRGQVYRRTHRYYWYGRGLGWFGGRRRRY
jgi:chromate transport protein ChrA